MAGTFTHWMVVEDALEKYRRSGRKHPYFTAILAKNHFVNLGAVGPDYPYLTDLKANMLKVHTWADRMHYENTGGLIKAAAIGLLARQGEEFGICLAWLCGFVSHVIADSVVHPAVNAVVGPYMFNSTEHRHCEMIQDSYIFREIKGTELRYSEYVEIMTMCSDPEDEERIHPAIRMSWAQALMDSHPGATEKFDHIRPDAWHENFLSRISLAESPAPIFRHFGEEKNLVYKRVDDFDPGERSRFIEEIRLPGGRTGKFREDVFDKAVAEVVEAWHRLFIDLERRDLAELDTYIKNWNLDTGVDEHNIHFWS